MGLTGRAWVATAAGLERSSPFSSRTNVDIQGFDRGGGGSGRGQMRRLATGLSTTWPWTMPSSRLRCQGARRSTRAAIPVAAGSGSRRARLPTTWARPGTIHQAVRQVWTRRPPEGGGPARFGAMCAAHAIRSARLSLPRPPGGAAPTAQPRRGCARPAAPAVRRGRSAAPPCPSGVPVPHPCRHGPRRTGSARTAHPSDREDAGRSPDPVRPAG